MKGYVILPGGLLMAFSTSAEKITLQLTQQNEKQTLCRRENFR